MVKLGNNEVIFSESFVMDLHSNNSASFTNPGQPGYPYELKLVTNPTEQTELPADRWHKFEPGQNGGVLSFAVLPSGRTEFYSISVGMATQGFQVQVIRQAIWNNLSMLVHIVVVKEPR